MKKYLCKDNCKGNNHTKRSQEKQNRDKTSCVYPYSRYDTLLVGS